MLGLPFLFHVKIQAPEHTAGEQVLERTLSDLNEDLCGHSRLQIYFRILFFLGFFWEGGGVFCIFVLLDDLKIQG